MASPTEKAHRLKDLVNAAHITARAAERGTPDTAVVHTPYGKATVHLDEEGADVKLASGATVHVRRG